MTNSVQDSTVHERCVGTRSLNDCKTRGDDDQNMVDYSNAARGRVRCKDQKSCQMRGRKGADVVRVL